MEQNKKLPPPFQPTTNKPKAVPGKHGMGYSTARHLARMAMQKVAKEKEPVKEAKEFDMVTTPGASNKEPELKHRVSVTVSDPQHTMVSKRGEKMEKRVRLYANDEQHAVTLAKHHFKRQGYKVHDAHHIGITEEAEQIDELEKSTLASYVKKASHNAGIKRQIAGQFDQKSASAKKLSKKQSWGDLSTDWKNMARKRQAGIDKAVDRLAKEEVEQIDELQKSTLASYVKKASGDVAAKSYMSGTDMGKGEYKAGATRMQAAVKRRQGIDKAVNRLAREEVEMNEAVTVKKKNYSWGKMVTVHHGSDTSYPLHPEHQKAIKRLRNGDKTSFKDETGRNVHVHREGDKVHLMSKEGNYKPTTVDYKHFDEELSFKKLRTALHEKTLTPAEMKKREEVAKAIERENPNMPMGMKMAIATKTAKRVAEEEDVHYCAKHVRSNLLGDGVVLEAMHADPDENGDIEWYMVEFKNGIHKVYTEDLEIMVAEYHGNHKKKKRMTNG